LEDKIHKYQDGIDELKDRVEKNSEKILRRLNFDNVMDDPRKYLMIYAKAFYEGHSNELLKAIDIGRDHAKDMMK
tara:strand:+ start:972 stop:1196 length:225 start_codon:yes stop_codon:yes gene_type:complete